jgi:hypothetical protein
METDEATGVRTRFRLSFSNGWRPGFVATEDVESAESVLGSLGDLRWCWVPDESSDLALKADRDMLLDHLEVGDPAWLIEPAGGDMVHVQSIGVSKQ